MTTPTEVNYLTRASIVAFVLVALLACASPAFAFNGYRGDYTTTIYCQVCHTTSPGNPVYNEWAETKHAESNGEDQATRDPLSSCAGCHTANYAPGKPSPSPSGTSYVWNNNPNPVAADTGNAASSELFVGCSSCHYGVAAPAPYGGDSNNTAHSVAMSEMANADICGQCHSRYAYTKSTYSIIPVPTPGAKTLAQPQFAIGFPMLGDPGGGFVADPLSTNLIVQHPGWTPSPNPSATAASGLMTYWKIDGVDSVWQQKGHDGSAAQYPGWASEGHANALVDLKAVMGPNPPASCLECHSADYRIAEEDEKPTGAEAKYGVTCVGCHTPHEKGTVTGAWDEAFDAQLVGDSTGMCTDCHNGELNGKEATPGSTVHHPMKEMMDGVGAIDVPKGSPSVHKGKCIECHMPPTSYSRGSVQLGGNHTFTIIEPEEAVEASPIPVATTTAKATSTPTPGTTRVTTTLTVTQNHMPYSACSTCHDANEDALPVVVSTVTTSPNPTPAPTTTAVTVVVTQNAGGGDTALWLQKTLDQRHEAMQMRIDEVTAELVAGSARMGYPAGTSDADTISKTLAAIAARPAADRTASEINFQKGYTNRTFVEAEGSMGIHNYAYANAVVAKALEEAKAVKTSLTGITIKATLLGYPYTVLSPVYGDSVVISGMVTGGQQPDLVGGMVKLWRQNAGSSTWNVIASTYLGGDSSDEYSFTIVPSKDAVYKAQFAGNDTYDVMTSETTPTIGIAWKVGFKASRTTVAKGSVITFSGSVGPADQAVAGGGNVVIQRKSGATWKTWKTAGLSDTGSYSTRVKMSTPGTYVLRATFPADGSHSMGISNSKTITVNK
jgi:hypothetical protein